MLVLTKNGNYLIVNRLCFLSLSLPLPRLLFLFLSFCLSIFLPSSLDVYILPSPPLLHPLTWYTHLAAIVIYTGRLSLLVADGEQEEKRRCAERMGNGRMVRARGRGLGYSADSRATVHTPKRVFVRFHFTPNYLVHTREGKGKGRRRRGENEREGDREKERGSRGHRCATRAWPRCKNILNVVATLFRLACTAMV